MLEKYREIISFSKLNAYNSKENISKETYFLGD